MARYVLLCTIDETKLDLFSRHRAAHYQFLIAAQHQIIFGGPARIAEGGRPETMIIVIEASSLAEAEAFITAEPYNAHGGFAQVLVRPWSQVVPEMVPGELQRTYDTEMAKAENQQRN